MFNINFLYEFENQFLKFKISLRRLLRAVVQKGMSRMYQIDLFDWNCKDIISEILNTNLTDKQFMLIQELIDTFYESMNKIVQQFIDEEVNEFIKENPHASRKGEIDIERNTGLGPIRVKLPRFRNAEFKSVIIQKKCRNFFTETMLLAMIVMNGLMSYDRIKTFFKLKGVNISNAEISRVTSIVNKYRELEVVSQEMEINPHQLAVFIDGVWVKYKTKEISVNRQTGEVTEEIKVNKRVKLNVIGIDADGKKKAITSTICEREDSEGYYQILSKLKYELGIEKIDVIISDGSKALDDPLLELYPDTKRQRCVTHVMRNLKVLMSKNQRKAIFPLIQKIYHCESKEQAKQLWGCTYQAINVINPRVAKQLKKTIDETLTFYDLPKSLWRACYTNNISENLNSVFRRFSPSNTCFPNLESVNITTHLTFLRLNSIYKNYDLY